MTDAASIRKLIEVKKENGVVRDEIIKRLVPIMEDMFEVDGLVYADSLSAEDIEDWDSLSHIRFMVAVEKQFGVNASRPAKSRISRTSAHSSIHCRQK